MPGRAVTCLRSGFCALLFAAALPAPAQFQRSVRGSDASIAPPESSRMIFSRGIVPTHEEMTMPSTNGVDTSTASLATETVVLASTQGGDTAWVLQKDLRSGISLSLARDAWAYFEKTYQPRTGWFDSVAGYPSATLWDIASGFAAVACAMQLGVLPTPRGHEMLARAIRTLAGIKLYNGELPNRTYHTGTAVFDGAQAIKGSGWSALDIGRLLIWLRLISTWYPEHAPAIAAVVGRWKFDRVAQQGAMYGTLYNGSREYLRQEGRLGYEQYSARGYVMWGLPMTRAIGYGDTLPVQVNQVALLADQRNLPFLTSEPFLLAAFELGALDTTFTRLTTGLYQAQQQRWRDTGTVTAITEDSINRSPWFVYYNVSYQGRMWHCVDHTGKPAADMCGLSTKAALGWASLFDDDYALLLEQTALPFHGPQGFWAGRYESAATNTVLSINTNAVILEAMLFRQRGRRAFAQNF